MLVVLETRLTPAHKHSSLTDMEAMPLVTTNINNCESGLVTKGRQKKEASPNVFSLDSGLKAHQVRLLPFQRMMVTV